MLIGEATRLPGKPFVDFHGKPLFKHGHEVLEELFDNVLVSCVPSIEEKLKVFDAAYVVDERQAGPLSGIEVGFKALSSEYVFVTACDMPYLNHDVINSMQSLLRLDGVIPRHPDGYLEPLHAIYKREKTLEILGKTPEMLKKLSILAGEFDMVYLDTEIIREVDFDLKSFININTRKELLSH